MRQTQADSKRQRGGFTLVELLVVILIIGILAAVALSLGARVRDSGKARLTEQVINVMDLALTSYKSDKQALPPTHVIIDGVAWPMADARNLSHDVPDAGNTFLGAREGPAMLNSVGYFVEEANSASSAADAIKGLDARLLTLVDIDAVEGDEGPQPSLPTVLDAWGNPIRFVHGAFQRDVIGDDTNATVGIDRTGDPDGNFSRYGLPSSFPSATWGTDSMRRNHQYTDADGVASGTDPASIASSLEVNSKNLPDSDGGFLQGRAAYFYSAGSDGRVGRLRSSTLEGRDVSDSPESPVVVTFDDDNISSAVPILPN